eukprot:scaffold416993_cov25-Prasinocladus_malaysianus.AAC.1
MYEYEVHTAVLPSWLLVAGCAVPGGYTSTSIAIRGTCEDVEPDACTRTRMVLATMAQTSDWSDVGLET